MSVNNQIDFSMLDFTSELDLIEDEDDVFEEQWNTDSDKNFLIDSKNQCTYVLNETMNNCITKCKPHDLMMMEVNIRSLPTN